MSHFQPRSIVSISLFLVFVIMLVTSILMFIQSHTTWVAIAHIIVGFFMLLTLVWHLKNNFKVLKNHIKPKNSQSTDTKLNLSGPFALVLVGLLLLGSVVEFKPFQNFYNWGNTLRTTGAQPVKEQKEVTYQIVEMNLDKQIGQNIAIEMKKGPYFYWPQYAIWLETLEGEFVQPLYVTEKIAKNDFANKAEHIGDQVLNTHLIADKGFNIDERFVFKSEPETKDQRMRPESLPVFLHKLGIKNTEGKFVPNQNQLIPDGLTGATMFNNFELTTQPSKQLSGAYRLRFELNQSFDFNDYYSSDRFPDDPVYSGSGFSAQPSVIYEAVINLGEDTEQLVPMKLIGRGHHSGADGKIYTDLENMSTALEMVDRLRVATFSSKSS